MSGALALAAPDGRALFNPPSRVVQVRYTGARRCACASMTAYDPPLEGLLRRCLGDLGLPAASASIVEVIDGESDPVRHLGAFVLVGHKDGKRWPLAYLYPLAGEIGEGEMLDAMRAIGGRWR